MVEGVGLRGMQREVADQGAKPKSRDLHGGPSSSFRVKHLILP